MTHEKPYAHLLEASFPGIKSTIARCEALGFSWEDLCGRVFVKQHEGNVISHVAALQCRVLIDKKWHRMVNLHAVCTKKITKGKALLLH